MTTNRKEQTTVFVSYAHGNKAYAQVFIKEFEKHSGLPKPFKWIARTDKESTPGIREQASRCDLAILLVSPGFPDPGFIAKYIKGHEPDFFPVLLETCDLDAWDERAKRRIFMPHGAKFGRPWADRLSYSDLLELDAKGLPKPNPMRPRYMTALVRTLEQSFRHSKPKIKKKKESEEEKNQFFRLVKPGKELLPEDILGPGKRSAVNPDFYWQRKPDEILDEHLKNRRSVMIVGNTLSGKTRMLYEHLKNMKHTTVMVVREKFPPPPKNAEDLILPDTGTRNYIAVFDDIDRFPAGRPAGELETLLKHLMEKKVLIVATCRRGGENRAFEGLVSSRIREHLETVYINRMTEKQVESFFAFCNKKAKDENTLDKKAYDGNIGSYFMDLTLMADRYFKLETVIKKYEHLTVPEKLPREILRTLKLFYYTGNTDGNSTYNTAKVKDFCERSLLGKRDRPKSKEKPLLKKKQEAGWQQQLTQFASPVHRDAFSPTEWNDAVTVLSDPDYDLNFLVPGTFVIHMDDVYLEKIVDRGTRPEHITSTIQAVYRGENPQKHGFMTSTTGFVKLVGMARSADEAYKTLLKLKSMNIRPDEIAFIPLFSKTKTFKEALFFLGKMVANNITPGNVTFAALMYKAGNAKDSLALLDKMKTYGITPEEATLNSFVNKAETSQDALLFLDKMKENGFKADSFTFTSLINNAQDFKQSMAFFGKMEEHELKPNIFTFTSLIAKAGAFKDVVALLKQMRTANIYPNKYTLNLLTRKVKENPRRAVEDIFDACALEDIFKEHLFNRLVGEACKADASCLERVVPHAELIAKQKDSVIVYYARMLEYSGAADTALEILESLETKTFDYYNIKANCLKATDFQQAFELYKQALEITEEKDAGQKVIVHNNTAQLILDHKQTGLYAEAAEHCKAALKLRPYHQFPYPGDLLLLFTIHESTVETVKENVEEVLKTYKINRQALSSLADKIDDPEKKKRLTEKD